MDLTNPSIEATTLQAIAVDWARRLRDYGLSMDWATQRPGTADVTFKHGGTYEYYAIKPDTHDLGDCSDRGRFTPEQQYIIKAAIAAIKQGLKTPPKEERKDMDINIDDLRIQAGRATILARSTSKALETKAQDLYNAKRLVTTVADQIRMEELNCPVEGSNDTERKKNREKWLSENPKIKVLQQQKQDAEAKVFAIDNEIDGLTRTFKIEMQEAEIFSNLVRAIGSTKIEAPEPKAVSLEANTPTTQAAAPAEAIDIF